jgi:hypothetical protein
VASFWIEVVVLPVELNDSLLIKVDRSRLVVVVDELRDSDSTDRPDKLIELTGFARASIASYVFTAKATLGQESCAKMKIKSIEYRNIFGKDREI